MSTLLDRILIVAALIVMAQCSIQHAEAYERTDCAWLANTAYTAVVMAQEHQMPRENYHVYWTDEDSAWAAYGESELDAAFEWKGSPKSYAEAVFGRCVGTET